MGTNCWKILPHGILRSTGFPIHLITQLAFDETATLIDRLLDLEDELNSVHDAIRATVEHSRQCGMTMSQVLRLACKQVHRRQPVHPAALVEAPESMKHLLETWNRLLSARQAADTAAHMSFEHELTSRRKQLCTIAADAAFQEACFLSSPQMYAHGVLTYLRDGQPRRSSDLKRLERQLISYLQRLCCKNETASFFGPIQYVTVDSAAQNGLEYRPTAGTERREAFMAFWAVRALAEQIAADPDMFPYLTVRRHPLCTEDQQGAFWLQGAQARRLPLDADAHLLRLTNCGIGAGELGSRLEAEGWSREHWINRLAALRKAGLLLVGFDLPVTALRALDALQNRVTEVPPACPARSRWLRLLAEFTTLVTEFGRAPLSAKQTLLAEIEQLFASVTGQEPRRNPGSLYADRLIVYEEALGAMGPVRMSPTLGADIARRLEPALMLAASMGMERRQELQARLLRTFDQLSPAGTPIPFVRLLQAGFAEGAAPVERPTTAPLQRLQQLVGARHTESVVRVEPDELGLPSDADLAADGFLTSPDVLMAAASGAEISAGTFDLVLGECHDTAMLWGWALAFHPRAAEVQRAVAEAFASLPTGTAMANVLSSKRAKIVPFEYPGYTIEVQAASDRPVSQRIPLGQVLVERTGRTLTLVAPPHEGHFRLYNGELNQPEHGAFALPRCVPPTVDAGEHTPRIMLGDLVYQRERWRLSRERLLSGTYTGSSFELFRDFRRAARAFRLPRFLYVRTPRERKPFFVDSANYFLVELLEYFLQPGDEAVLSEMIPAPDQLWLAKADGRYCAEFRLCAFHRSAGAAEEA